MRRRFSVKTHFLVTIIILLNIVLAGSMSFAQEKNMSLKIKSTISETNELGKANIEIANVLIKYIGAIATIFGIILALAGIFIGLEGIRSRQRREEAIKTLEDAKIYVDKTVSEYQKTMKSKIDEIELLSKESIKLAREQLNRDVEDLSKSVQEAKDRVDRDTKIASKAIKEREEKGIKTDAELKIEQLSRRIKLFEEVGIPDDHELLYSKALILEEKGMFEETVELLRKVIAINPKYKSAYFRLGWNENKLGHYEEAIKAYNKYIEDNPKEPASYNNIGVALEGLKRYKEASEAYKKALEIKPDEELYKSNYQQSLKRK